MNKTQEFDFVTSLKLEKNDVIQDFFGEPKFRHNYILHF